MWVIHHRQVPPPKELQIENWETIKNKMTTYREFGFCMFKKYEKNLDKMTVFKYLYIISDNCSDSEYS